MSEDKVNMVLVNKADLLSRQQRRAWARHFQKDGLRAVFWSALAESNRLDAEDKVTLTLKMTHLLKQFVIKLSVSKECL